MPGLFFWRGPDNSPIPLIQHRLGIIDIGAGICDEHHHGIALSLFIPLGQIKIIRHGITGGRIPVSESPETFLHRVYGLFGCQRRFPGAIDRAIFSKDRASLADSNRKVRCFPVGIHGSIPSCQGPRFFLFSCIPMGSLRGCCGKRCYRMVQFQDYIRSLLGNSRDFRAVVGLDSTDGLAFHLERSRLEALFVNGLRIAEDHCRDTFSVPIDSTDGRDLGAHSRNCFLDCDGIFSRG